MKRVQLGLYRRHAVSTGRSLLTVGLLMCTGVSEATVMEFGDDGEQSIRFKGSAKTSTSNALEQTDSSQWSRASDAELRTLTRKIALDHSGTIGVRKAGLSAFTFAEVFEALVERESAFNPTAISPKGAKGLGQLMPGTASDMGVMDPFDPEANLVGSAKYLTLLLAEFGSLKPALAAYNAGPARVRKHGGVPPFAETKAYIDWIFKKAGIAPATPQPIVVSAPASKPINEEQSLNGDVSVWEF